MCASYRANTHGEQVADFTAFAGHSQQNSPQRLLQHPLRTAAVRPTKQPSDVSPQSITVCAKAIAASSTFVSLRRGFDRLSVLDKSSHQ